MVLTSDSLEEMQELFPDLDLYEKWDVRRSEWKIKCDRINWEVWLLLEGE